MSPSTTVVLAGARTPFGRFLGTLAPITATELGGHAIEAALARASLTGSDVDAVVMGQVLTAGVGQIPARQAAVRGGVPMSVPATTINKVCLSGTAAIGLADLMIRAGEAQVVVAGGQESMSRAPHLLRTARTGHSFGDLPLADHMERDGLWDAFTDQGMGPLTEAGNEGAAYVSREDQDAAAAASHRRAAAAWESGLLGEGAGEVAPYAVPRRGADPLVLDRDEGVRPGTTPEGLARLRPAFLADGTITAGSSSQISDGAAALVLASRERAEAEGWPWLAEIVGYGTVAGPDSRLQVQPANAIAAACAKAGVAPTDLDQVEINEAFAAVSVAATRLLGLDPERVNPHGGAIALGHPIGASGARLALHLALSLARGSGGSGYGAVGLCGGGGQGDALVLRSRAAAGSGR